MGLPVKTYLHVFATFGKGGPQRRAIQLMQRAGPEVRHLLLPMDGRIDAIQWANGDLQIEFLAPPSGVLPLRLARMVSRLRRERPDLLLTYNWGSIEWLLAARLAGQRAVIHHEDGFNPEEEDRLLRRRCWARRILLRWVGALVVPSKTLAKIAETDWGVGGPRLHCLANGVELGSFSATVREDRKGCVFGCVGSLRPVKNQVLALEALARSGKDLRLILVGDGPDESMLRARAEELGIAGRVEFVGAVTDTAAQYQRMDAFLIPSRSEQMPIALLEAMASGLPVVGTDVGDVSIMVAEENRSLLVATGDVEALAAAMGGLAGDPALRKRLGERNRLKVEAEYQASACYGRYLDLYREFAS